MINIRRDPYERGLVTSNTYDDRFLDLPYLLIPAQDYVAQFRATFQQSPPRHKAAAFNLDNILEELTQSTGSH